MTPQIGGNVGGVMVGARHDVDPTAVGRGYRLDQALAVGGLQSNVLAAAAQGGNAAHPLPYQPIDMPLNQVEP
jgi:hypothetical protein